MIRSLTCCAVSVACLSAHANADPVTVISHTTGTVQISNPALGLIDVFPDDYDFEAGAPFDLYMETSFDPASADIVTDYYGNPTDYSTHVHFTLRVGDREASYTGLAQATVGLSPTGYYRHTITMYYRGYDMTIGNTIFGPPGVLGTNPFALRSLDASSGASASFGVSLYPTNPDAPGSWGDGATARFASLNVVSAVPEPRACALFMAGFVVLNAIGRRPRASARNPAGLHRQSA